MSKDPYAIIATGGKQYRVKKGDVIAVELLKEADDKVKFSDVLFVGSEKEQLVGAPHVEGYTVEGKILGETKGPKVSSIKFKRRKSQYRRFGHRQKYSQVEVTKIGKGA